MIDLAETLIKRAQSTIYSHRCGEFQCGQVGAALITPSQSIYTGVCIDTGSSMGFCAEHNAIGTMITNKETQIEMIVAVWINEHQQPYVVSPCGRCRQFILSVDARNIETKVIIAPNKTCTLRELLPYANSYIPIT